MDNTREVLLAKIDTLNDMSNYINLMKENYIKKIKHLDNQKYEDFEHSYDSETENYKKDGKWALNIGRASP